MTVKEYKALCADIYKIAIKNNELASLINTGAGVVYIYDCKDSAGNHAVLTPTHKTQLNTNTLINAGINPENADCKLCMTLNRATKSAIL